jgi:hypothetical protein
MGDKVNVKFCPSQGCSMTHYVLPIPIKAVIKAIERHLSQGRQVYLTIPLGNQKQDFNDLMKQGGVSAVHNALEKVVEIKDGGVLKTGDLNTVIEKIRMSEIREIQGIKSQNLNVQARESRGVDFER